MQHFSRFHPLIFLDFKFLHIYNSDNASILNEPFQDSDNITVRYVCILATYLRFLFSDVLLTPCFSNAGIYIIFWNTFICIIYISEIHVHFDEQRPLICPFVTNVNWSTYFHRTPLPASLISKFTQIQFFHVARRQKKTDGKTYMAKFFVALRESFSDTQILDPRQWTSLSSTNLNKEE